MPPAAIWAKAPANAAYIWSGVGSGIRARTSPWASSLSTPVGSPPASRTISPPVGSGVPASMPAMARARLLTHRLWPSDPFSAIGREVASASRIALCGSVSVGVPAGFQASTTSQESGSPP